MSRYIKCIGSAVWVGLFLVNSALAAPVVTAAVTADFGGFGSSDSFSGATDTDIDIFASSAVSFGDGEASVFYDSGAGVFDVNAFMGFESGCAESCPPPPPSGDHSGDLFPPPFEPFAIVSSTLTWTDTFANSTGSSLDLFFDFFVPDSFLTLDSDVPDPSGDGFLPAELPSYASITAGILVDGAIAWAFDATLESDPGDPFVFGDGASSLTQTIIGDIGAPSFDCDPFATFCVSDPFEGALDLGILGAGDAVTVSYFVNAEIGALPPAFAGDSLFAEADYTDPFGFNSFAFSTPVPTPNGLLLLGFGMLGLGIRNRIA